MAKDGTSRFQAEAPIGVHSEKLRIVASWNSLLLGEGEKGLGGGGGVLSAVKLSNDIIQINYILYY